MIAYDCNGKVLNVGNHCLIIKVSKFPCLLGRECIIASEPYEDPIDKDFVISVSITINPTPINPKEWYSKPSMLLKITPDTDVKENEKELVLVNH
jgi:hypothetical protein